MTNSPGFSIQPTEWVCYDPAKCRSPSPSILKLPNCIVKYRVSDRDEGDSDHIFANGTYGKIGMDGAVDKEVAYAYFEPTPFSEWHIKVADAGSGLDLSGVELVVLSGCETGLGMRGHGRVYSLQQAFHMAGCKTVIASLWRVNDAATAALMAKFYHELWVNKKPPIEALREAQLTIYYHPELIPDLAGERGAPKLKEAAAVKSGEPAAPATGPKRAATKLWAAFVLSGVGK